MQQVSAVMLAHHADSTYRSPSSDVHQMPDLEYDLDNDADAGKKEDRDSQHSTTRLHRSSSLTQMIQSFTPIKENLSNKTRQNSALPQHTENKDGAEAWQNYNWKQQQAINLAQTPSATDQTFVSLPQFDLVLATYTISQLSSDRARVAATRLLWQMIAPGETDKKQPKIYSVTDSVC